MKIQGLDAAAPLTRYNERSSRQSSSQVRGSGNLTDGPARQTDDQTAAKYDESLVKDAVGQINKTMEMYNTELRFTLHQESGEYFVKVVNPRDNTVIREIPPERILDIVAHVKEMLGLIIDKHI